MRKELLEEYKKKQPFQVTIGRSKWVNYEKFDPKYNLREILSDEVVIEFDLDNPPLTYWAINITCLNLLTAGYHFEVWKHEGKSPHLHIHNLSIKNLGDNERSLFKRMFAERYVPEKFHRWLDKSLFGRHLIALEWAKHWKIRDSGKKYDRKVLIIKR